MKGCFSTHIKESDTTERSIVDLGQHTPLLAKAMASQAHTLCQCCFNPNTSTELVHWSFNGTLDDISSNQRGPAIIVGSNVKLAFETSPITGQEEGYISIRNPGFLNLPRVDVRAISFTSSFSLRLHSQPTTRQVLISNWSRGNWQYINFIEPSGLITSTLRRNMDTNGSNPDQDLVHITSSQPVPIGTWFNVSLSYNAPTRTYSIYLNGKLSGSSVIRPAVTDTTLHTSSAQYAQFGNKADDNPDQPVGQLNADLRNLRCFMLNVQ
ncbi:hypothetical protein D9613_001172 [Agrocybe pediades]|uniref:LamG domain-containing protein n=1 Tax=Agrocybe pediades TaxID=84607 RepID=A0A8H4VV40_9AGAR|nr:hypothetical protein D9613_001172 [Agrocybe pediades]